MAVPFRCQGVECCVLNKNDPHGIMCLHVWSPTGGRFGKDQEVGPCWSKYDLVGKDMSLGVSFEVSKPHARPKVSLSVCLSEDQDDVALSCFSNTMRYDHGLT